MDLFDEIFIVRNTMSVPQVDLVDAILNPGCEVNSCAPDACNGPRPETLRAVYLIPVHRQLGMANQLSAVSDVAFIDIASPDALKQRSFS